MKALEQAGVGVPGALAVEDDAPPLPPAALEKVLHAVEGLHLRALWRRVPLVGKVLPPGLAHGALLVDDAAVAVGVDVVILLVRRGHVERLDGGLGPVGARQLRARGGDVLLHLEEEVVVALGGVLAGALLVDRGARGVDGRLGHAGHGGGEGGLCLLLVLREGGLLGGEVGVENGVFDGLGVVDEGALEEAAWWWLEGRVQREGVEVEPAGVADCAA